MKITSYTFGKITIEGNLYDKDVIIYPDHVFSPWWRKEGHLLHSEDLDEIINTGITILIIGTGYYNTMVVPNEIIAFLESRGIKTKVENTKRAVEIFNSIPKSSPAIAALHLTC